MQLDGGAPPWPVTPTLGEVNSPTIRKLVDMPTSSECIKMIVYKYHIYMYICIIYIYMYICSIERKLVGRESALIFQIAYGCAVKA